MRSFLGFGQVPYIGIPQARACKYAGIAGQAVPLLFQWISYGAATAMPNINVLVDISQAPCKAIDAIRSVYIDNLGSSVPVYVFFPDTFYAIVAKPNSEGWYPAFTNARQCWVIGEGFLDGSTPQTVVILSNIAQIPAVNTELDQSVALWKASPVITRGNSIYNQAFGIPALGDQAVSYINTLTAPGVLQNNLWGTPYSSGFIYLTHIDCTYATGIIAAGATATYNYVLESTGIAGILYSLTGLTVNVLSGAFNSKLLNFNAMNIKLDATQTWRLRLVSMQNPPLTSITLVNSFNFTQST